MVEANILCIKVNGNVVYIKNKEVDCIPNGENFTCGKNSASSLELDTEVLTCREV